MRITSASPQKQQNYENKLRMIDQHLIKQAKIGSLNIDTQAIFKLMNLNYKPDPPQQMQLFVPKVILFDDKKPRRFRFKEQPLQNGKKYMLNIQTQTSTRIGISVNETKPKMYHLNANKAIVIHQQPWKELVVIIQVDKIGPFSSIRLVLDLIQTQFRNNKKSSICIRPNISGQLEEYLKNNKGRAGQILKQRSVARMKTSLSRRRIQSTNTISRGDLHKDSDFVRTKSELFKFEKKKEFYIRHVERMSPQKTKELKLRQIKYKSIKHKQMAQMAKLITLAKFGIYLRDQGVKLRQQKLKQMTISLMCMDFVKILKGKFKLKMTLKARTRMTNLHYFNRMPAILHESCVQRSRATLFESLMVYMQFKGLQEICQNSEEYLNGLKKIQYFFRRKRMSLFERIRIFTDRLCYIYQIEITSKLRQNIVQSYYKYSQGLNRIRFRVDKDRLLHMIREMVEMV